MRISIALSALLFAACVTPGERALTGECPSGEVCSSLTPRGLSFDGARMADLIFDAGLHRVAVGGTQTISIIDEAANGPLTHRWAATTGSRFTVEGTAGAALEVRANAGGDDRLRIVDANNGELFDRVTIEARELARVALRTPLGGESTRDGTPLAVWHGSRPQILTALLDAQGERLVDESLVIDNGPVDQLTWDSARLDATGDAPVISFLVTLGAGEPRRFSLPNVNAIDAVEILDAPPTIVLHQTAIACFAAVADGADVLGAPWRFAASGPGQVRDDAFFGPNCALITADAFGTITVTAEVDGVVRQISLDVTANGSRVRELPEPELAGPTLGERASF